MGTAPMPDGYAGLEVKEISHFCFAPKGAMAVVWFESSAGQKVCLSLKMIDLERLTMAIELDQRELSPPQ